MQDFQRGQLKVMFRDGAFGWEPGNLVILSKTTHPQIRVHSRPFAVTLRISRFSRFS